MNRQAFHAPVATRIAIDPNAEFERWAHFRRSLKMTLISAGVAALLLGLVVALAAARANL
jgi:hypothetical protein